MIREHVTIFDFRIAMHLFVFFESVFIWWWREGGGEAIAVCKWRFYARLAYGEREWKFEKSVKINMMNIVNNIGYNYYKHRRPTAGE